MTCIDNDQASVPSFTWYELGILPASTTALTQRAEIQSRKAANENQIEVLVLDQFIAIRLLFNPTFT